MRTHRDCHCSAPHRTPEGWAAPVPRCVDGGEPAGSATRMRVAASQPLKWMKRWYASRAMGPLEGMCSSNMARPRLSKKAHARLRARLCSAAVAMARVAVAKVVVAATAQEAICLCCTLVRPVELPTMCRPGAPRPLGRASVTSCELMHERCASDAFDATRPLMKCEAG